MDISVRPNIANASLVPFQPFSLTNLYFPDVISIRTGLPPGPPTTHFTLALAVFAPTFPSTTTHPRTLKHTTSHLFNDPNPTQAYKLINST